MTEVDSMKDECIAKIQRYVGMILLKSRQLKRQKEPRALLEEMIKLAKDMQEECLR